MSAELKGVGQIALTVSDLDTSEAFYEQTLGLTKLYRYGDMVFFDCGGVRLMLSKQVPDTPVASQQAVYFKCDDIAGVHDALAERGLVFERDAHLVAPMPDHDLWMAFFRDPDGHLFALMYEAPKGYAPKQNAPASDGQGAEQTGAGPA